MSGEACDAEEVITSIPIGIYSAPRQQYAKNTGIDIVFDEVRVEGDAM
jgi:hypothetical protein